MKIGLLGIGTVGNGVYELIEQIHEVKHVNMEVKRVLVRPGKTIAPERTDDFLDILNDPEINTVVEVMGGLNPAYEYVAAALRAGKHVVTANKQLVSVHGTELVHLAGEHNVLFLFSAACGGGIPFLRNISSAKRTDEIFELGGILNGTTNFILDSMTRRHMSFEDALQQAQALGFAELDPSADLNGIDTLRKCMLSCAVAFDIMPLEESVPVAGIAKVKSRDIEYLESLGYVCRLVTHAGRQGNGLFAYVEPTLFHASNPEYAITDNLNIAWYQSKYAGRMSFSGQGAGKLPTASAVIRDLLDVYDNRDKRMLSTRCSLCTADNSAVSHSYYIRLVADKMPAALEPHIDSISARDGWLYYMTKPISVADMHALAASLAQDHPDIFFAGVNA